MTPVVEAIETARVTMRAAPDLVVRGAKGAHDVSDFLLVRVRVGDGVEGYGEVSATPLWSGEDGVTARHLIRNVLAPALVGQSLAPVGALEARMDHVLAQNPFTKAGVSIALWDAFARTVGLPLATVLGGPYRVEVPIKLSLSGTRDELVRAHAAATAAGFGAFKVKVGLDPAGDVARFAQVRDLVGPDTQLGADANGAGPGRRRGRRSRHSPSTVSRSSSSRWRRRISTGCAPCAPWVSRWSPTSPSSAWTTWCGWSMPRPPTW